MVPDECVQPFKTCAIAERLIHMIGQGVVGAVFQIKPRGELALLDRCGIDAVFLRAVNGVLVIIHKVDLLSCF